MGCVHHPGIWGRGIAPLQLPSYQRPSRSRSLIPDGVPVISRERLAAPSCTAHPLRSSVAETDASRQTRGAFFYATESLLPAIDTVFAHTIEARRGIDADSFGQSRQDLNNDRNWCLQMRKGSMLGFRKRATTGGTMVHGA